MHRLRRHQVIIFNDIMAIYMDKIKIKFYFINEFSTFKNIVILVEELKFENYLDI
jgi:hypothetical protein